MKARANVNFALIKYWGKADEEKRLPNQASLSFTVDKLYTETSVVFDNNLKADVININNEANFKIEARVVRYLNLLRKEFNINSFVHLTSINNVPIGAGLASSSSSFSSIALAFTKSYGLNLKKEELSRLARLGSGSASRSVYGGFSMWRVGNDKSSVASSLNLDWPEFRIIVVLIDDKMKKVSSTEAMKKSLKFKSEYKNWVKQSKVDLEEMLLALDDRNIDEVGLIAERNSEHMHSLIEMTGIKYKNLESIKVIDKIKTIRKSGIKAYFTMDAGPNIKIITTKEYVDKIKNVLLDYHLIVCKSGLGAKIINEK